MVSTISTNEKLNNLNPTSFLKLTTKTWARDSHGLFDYEATTTKNNTLILNSPYRLIRKKNDVKHALLNGDLELDERELAKIKFDNGKNLKLFNNINFFFIFTYLIIN